MMLLSTPCYTTDIYMGQIFNTFILGISILIERYKNILWNNSSCFDTYTTLNYIYSMFELYECIVSDSLNGLCAVNFSKQICKPILLCM